MADETPVSPISAAEPPASAPALKPATTGAKTLKLNPVIRKPAIGATQTSLKPGLKLPPKPGLAAGLKLPPKPGATVSALRPGLNLPTKPGMGTQTALKPGLKLPPKPVIRKPGEATAALKPLPKPIVPGAAPEVADIPATPATPPPAASAPAVAQVAKPTLTPPAPVKDTVAPLPVDAQGVSKLPTVQSDPLARDEALAPKVEQPNSMDALKTVTQKLKGATQQIPAQAILHKTGIISDGAVSEAQKQALKSKTSRISLSDAMGVAPVKSEAVPMKTIRIKRPVDIPGATKPLSPLQKPVGAASPAVASPAVAPLAPVAEEPAVAEKPAAEAPSQNAAPAAPAATVTQRKTLKINRPGAVRPSGKFTTKRPGAAVAAKPAAATDSKPAEGEVADIPEIPDMPSASVDAPAAPAAPVSDVPGWLSTICEVVQIAACVTIGLVAWQLFKVFQLPGFCGGCM